MLACAAVPLQADPPKPSSCLIQPDKSVAVAPAPGRVVHCGLDLGSRSIKLSVLSMEPRRNASVKEERQCRRTLGLGAQVFDSRSGTARPLPAEAASYLSETIREFQKICTLDGGKVVAAGATQWARDAPNIAEVRARVKAETGLDFDVLSPRQEAEYGYVAGSIDTPGRLVLDPGSNSFQIAWQAKGATTVASILVPYGYVRGANEIEASDYASGRAAYQAKARAAIGDQLARLEPPMSLSALKAMVAEGTLGREIVTLGQDGAVFLPVRGLLRKAGGWVAEQSSYDEATRSQALVHDPAFGTMCAAPLKSTELEAYFAGITPEDFRLLTSEPIRSLYGQKALVVPALAALLLRELGAERLVMVPQETTTGLILAQLPRRAATVAKAPGRLNGRDRIVASS